MNSWMRTLFDTERFLVQWQRILNSLKLALLPVGEFFLLRFFQHELLKLKVGWGWIGTEYNLFLPLSIAFLGCTFLFQSEKNISFSFQKKWGAWHLLFLSLFLLYSLLAASGEFPLSAFSLHRIIWIGLAFIALLTGFFVFVSPQFYFRNPFSFTLPLWILAGFSLVLYQNSLSLFSPFLIPYTAQLSHSVIEFLLGRAIEFAPWKESFFLFRVEQFKVLLGAGCAGFDSLYFFTACFVLFGMLHRESLRIWDAIPLFLMGIGMVFIVNVLRISVLFVTGVALTHLLPLETVNWITLHVFHLHLGWLLSTAAISGYFISCSYLIAYRPIAMPSLFPRQSLSK